MAITMMPSQSSPRSRIHAESRDLGFAETTVRAGALVTATSHHPPALRLDDVRPGEPVDHEGRNDDVGERDGRERRSKVWMDVLDRFAVRQGRQRLGLIG